MHITILIPHFKVGMMTAYSIAQLLKYKGNHEIDILVIDNNAGDGSTGYLMPFMKDISIVEYPKDKLQSHGVAFDYVLPEIQTEYFITMESDSFPIGLYLDYYEDLVKSGIDAAGSKLQLSGGNYLHPCGAIYKTKLWHEAKAYCDNIQYNYYPNMAMRDNFPLHLMIHKSLMKDFEANPMDYVELSSEYKMNTVQVMEEKRLYYLPVTGPFHNGMGCRQESVKTYGQRTIESESASILLNNKCMHIIGRAGYEPGQWLSAWMIAMNKKVVYIPTETKWMPGKENQQQEFTVNEASIQHLWGISAYHDYHAGDPEITKVKQSLPDILYNTLPNHQKIH
jgi:hypothetical protein